MIRVLFIGDIVGKPGRKVLSSLLPSLKEKYKPSIIIANGENAAGGFGITPDVADEIFSIGVDVITSGNHIWDKKEIVEYLDRERRILRPANYPDSSPGKGSIILKIEGGERIAVVNLQGRVFMDSIDCPFRIAVKEIEKISSEARIIIVDFHAEATSEKAAMGWFLDGRVSAVVGTHTHVQTADERILSERTAFITDVGMVGSLNSVIGLEKEAVIKRFLTNMPQKFEPATKQLKLDGVIIDIDNITGCAINIERLTLPLE